MKRYLPTPRASHLVFWYLFSYLKLRKVVLAVNFAENRRDITFDYFRTCSCPTSVAKLTTIRPRRRLCFTKLNKYVLCNLNLSQKHQLYYVLFKCEHIFKGQNKNVGILSKTTPDDLPAAALLQQQGFAVPVSKKMEKVL